MKKDLYEILGINKNATEKEIKTAYKKLAKKYHPDICKNKECEEKFKKINEAYEILSNKEKRKQYNLYGEQIFNGNHQSNYDSSIFEEFFKNHFYEDFVTKKFQTEIPLSKALNGGSFNIENKEVRFPPGIKNGGKLKFKINNIPYELSVYVYSDNKNFKLIENDIYTEITIKFSEAITGVKTELDFFGKKLQIKVPEGIQNGTKLRIKNKGLGKNGHLFIKVNIKTPVKNDFNEKDFKTFVDILKRNNN